MTRLSIKSNGKKESLKSSHFAQLFHMTIAECLKVFFLLFRNVRSCSLIVLCCPLLSAVAVCTRIFYGLCVELNDLMKIFIHHIIVIAVVIK